MKARPYLPGPLENAKESFANGWYSGIAVGLVTGIGLAVALFR